MSALERVLERKGFIARHSGLRLCWPSLAIIGLLGLPFSDVFIAQFGLAFLLVSIFTSISHVMASDFRPSFLDFLGGGAFIIQFTFFFLMQLLDDIKHQSTTTTISLCFSFITLPIPSECLIFLRAHRRRKKARVESVDDVHRIIPTAT